MSRTFAATVAALAGGRAFVDLIGWRKTLVTGPDARAWLGDLVTADVAALEPGVARRSLLLSPTGRIRADVTIAGIREGFLIVQDPVQPSSIESQLSPYVLSSDVSLVERTERLAILAFTGDAVTVGGNERYAPSALGLGFDIVVDAGGRNGAREAALRSGLDEADEDAFDAWRIVRGTPRFGRDLSNDSLPHEAGLDDAIAYDKGCFLGQEAVAKVRNLGRPPFVVLALASDGPVRAGEAIVADGDAVGVVTSAVSIDGASHAIGRVRWAARGRPLRTGSAASLRPADAGS